jgi:DNA processing protein
MSDAALGLARLAAELDRDLQRASRRVGGPEALWAAAPGVLGAALRLDAEATRRAAHLRRSFHAAEERDVLAKAGIGFLGRGATGYPPMLDGIYDPPFGLFTRPAQAGPVIAPSDDRPVVAIVGARRAGPAARVFARGLAGTLARAGATIVSGMAHGVDAAAHEGALDAGGATVAVLGCGPDVAYPRRNRVLLQRVVSQGAICSEYWPGTRPAPWRFPARNRITPVTERNPCKWRGRGMRGMRWMPFP